MKKRTNSRSRVKRGRRRSDPVVEHPDSSELAMLDHIKRSPRIHRSEEQLIAKVNSATLMPVELHSDMTSHGSVELEEDSSRNSNHQAIRELPLILADKNLHLTDPALEMTAVAHAGKWDEDKVVDIDSSSKLADDSIGSQHIRSGSIFTKHLGFTPVRVLSERAPTLQFGSTSFLFEHLDQRELEINVLFTHSYEKADYTFVCTPNLAGTNAIIQEQYYDGVVVQVRREPKSLFDSTAPLEVNGALSWIVIG